MTVSDREFDALMREYVETEGARLLAEEAVWRDRVPEHTDRAARDALRQIEACVLAGVPLAAVSRAGARAVPRAAGLSLPAGAKTAAVSLAAAAAVTVGAYFAVPGVRELAGAALRPTAAPAETTQTARPARAPGDYAIPAPGGGFTVTDEAAGKRMAYRWFSSDRQEFLVEVADRFPEDPPESDGAEYVAVGNLWGSYWETENTRLLLLRDGDVCIRIEAWGASRAEILAYAEKLASDNS